MLSLKTVRAETEGQSLPTHLLLQFYIVEEVKPPQDSVSEALCIRQDLACGMEACKVRKSISVGSNSC